MNKFVIGDIHGGYKALLQCFERSGFDKEKDQLISIGDVADGWPEVPECVEELMTIKDHINIKGNHDQWLYEWMVYNDDKDLWIDQGGRASKKAYEERRHVIDWDAHVKFFGTQWNYYIDEENRAFVHGGWTDERGLGHEDPYIYIWNRSLINIAMSGTGQFKKEGIMPRILRPYDEIFVGHTTTEYWGKKLPIHACNVWNVDTGGGMTGKLTIMNIDTKEYWQSDFVDELYPGIIGRGKRKKRK